MNNSNDGPIQYWSSIKKENKGREEEKMRVMATADDAIMAKLSACLYGYYDDPFLSHFAQNARSSTHEGRQASSSLGQISAAPCRHSAGRSQDASGAQQQQPLIRRGTHARVCCIDRAISSFLKLAAVSHNQIVILGSGKDTSYLRAKAGIIHHHSADDSSSFAHLTQNTHWYEVDFSPLITSKCKLLSSCPSSHFTIVSVLDDTPSFSIATNDISTKKATANSSSHKFNYHLVSHDLNHSTKHLLSTLNKQFEFQFDSPTLFVMECVQMYLPNSTTTEIFTAISTLCREPIIAIYDPILMNDQFGKVMESNLSRAGLINRDMSLIQTRTLEQQFQKLKCTGFDQLLGCNMMEAYESIVTPQQRIRANQCEMLDEIEEWILIMRHYCFIVAGKSSASLSLPDSSITQKFCSTGTNSPIGFLPNKCTTSL